MSFTEHRKKSYPVSNPFVTVNVYDLHSQTQSENKSDTKIERSPRPQQIASMVSFVDWFTYDFIVNSSNLSFC